MQVLIEPGISGNILATIAIGKSYIDEWKQNALPSWEEYCRRHGLGLIVFDQEMLDRGSEVWKKATWQKLLIAETLAESELGLRVTNVCYLDTDILISPFAPDIFREYDPKTIAVVSQVHGLPQPLKPTLRRLAFLRHTRWDEKYPLDSALFMEPRQIFEFHDLTPHDNYFCAGLFVFNIENHRTLMKEWFEKYAKGVESITGGGDEAHVNYELQSWGQLSWLPYEFQALWTYETAWRYPFLFDNRNDENLIRACIEASLHANHFLHFAGSWHECQMWKIGGFFDGDKKRREIADYRAYLETPVTGRQQGLVRP